MKNRFYQLLLLFQVAFAAKAFSQNAGINTTGALPDTSAMLDITSTNKGLLIPRMTTAQMNAIPLPANGLLIYNTSINTFEMNTGIPSSPNWVPLASTVSGWNITGNAGTTAPTVIGSSVGTANFIGTTDSRNLALGTAGKTRMILDTLGNAYGGDGTTSVQALSGNAITANNSRNFIWGNNNLITSAVDANGGARTNAIFGANNHVYGDYFGGNTGAQNFVTGNTNNVYGSVSFVAGQNNSDSSLGSLVSGYKNIVGTTAAYGAVIGQNLTITQTATQIALGTYNKDTATAAFAIGAGNGSKANNAVTVSNGGSVPAYNGNVGINNVNNPLKRLHINAANSSDAADSLKIDNLATTPSAYNKSVLVIDSVTGYVSKISPSKIASNIYTADGTLTGNRILTLGGNTLNFYDAASSGTTTLFGAAQTITNSTATGRAELDLYAGPSSALYMFIDGGNDAQLTASATSLGFTTINAAPISFYTNSTHRLIIDASGKVGINTYTPKSTLEVSGSVAAAIRTTAASTTLTANDHTLILSGVAAANSITVTLPQASSCPGRIYVIVNNTAATSGSSTQVAQVISSYNGTATELKWSLGNGAATATYSAGTYSAGSNMTNQRTTWQSDGNIWWLVGL